MEWDIGSIAKRIHCTVPVPLDQIAMEVLVSFDVAALRKKFYF